MKPYPAIPDGLVVEHDGPILSVVLDRADRRNAITDDMVVALIEIIDAASSDDAIRVIALSARGDDFCSGFDLSARQGMEKPRTGSTQRRMRWHVNRLIPTMLESQTPIVVSAEGWVIGLGLNLVLASDFAVVADDARLWAPFTTFGFTPDSGASWLIPRLAGVARAKEMIMLGRRISGAQAGEWGMVHRAVPAAAVAVTAAELVDELSKAATVAVGLSKLLIHRAMAAELDPHLADEGFAMELSSRTSDFRESLAARREHRPPDFKGF